MNAPDPRPTALKAARVRPAPALRFDPGSLGGTTIHLEHAEGTLGRRPENHYVVADPRVSRVHVQIARVGDSGLVLTELGSSGGTTVNGEPVAGSKVVSHGDRVSFAGVTCTVEDPVAASVADDATMVLHLPPQAPVGPHLSPRQTEVLDGIGQGLTNAQIAERLGITERTVKAYAQELYVKLGVHNRAGAVAAAIKAGLY